MCAAAWKQKRRQALSLKGTPDRARSEQPSQASPTLDSAHSPMPQLGQSKHAPQAVHQAKGADPTAPAGLAAAPRLPARATNRFASPISHGKVLVTKHHTTAAAGGTAKQPPEEEQAPEVQRDGTVSTGQAPDKGQPSKKKKDQKEKKRKHKGSKQLSAAEESSTHQTSSSLAEASDQGRSSSLDPSSAAAAAADDDNQTHMVR